MRESGYNDFHIGTPLQESTCVPAVFCGEDLRAAFFK
jgi:hypothetical protein